MRTLLFSAILAILMLGCQSDSTKMSTSAEQGFTFVFMTDIHIMEEKNAETGFLQAIDSVNKMKPDFVITGGDLIMDALEQTYGKADSQYLLYQKTVKQLQMPVYHTIGNHEIFAWLNPEGVKADHPEYGEKMFEKRIGKRYQTFEHKGWRFFLLDGIEYKNSDSYSGLVDSVQMEWLKTELASIDSVTPLVIVTHIPFITTQTQLLEGSTLASGDGLVVSNSKQVLDLFNKHNLQLVLQGHLHWNERIYANNIHFVTSGAISGAWWQGAYRESEEGFTLITTAGNKIADIKYVDYGWTINK